MNECRPIFGLTINYRDPRRTSICVRSLLDNHLAGVLIWDNSEDGGLSAQSLRELFCNDLRVHISESPTNIGFAAAINSGLKWINGFAVEAWVLIINNDAILLNESAKALQFALVRSSDACIAVPNIRGQGQKHPAMLYNRWTGLINIRGLPGNFIYPSGCCFLLAPERTRTPIFDEDFFMYGEDVELGNYINKFPGSIAHVAEASVIHEGAASSGIATLFYESRVVAGHIIIARKLALNSIDYFLLVSARVVVLFLRAFMRALRFRSIVPISALFEGCIIAVGRDPMRR